MSDTVTPLREALDNPQDAPQMAAAGDAPERAKREAPPFPIGCPIVPLGISSDTSGSQKCYYLDSNKQLVALEAGNRHGKNSLIALFGADYDWLEESFPQWSKPVYEGRGANRHCVKDSEIIGFDQAEASMALIVECTRRGPFSAANKTRGSGAHLYKDGTTTGGLMLHCGDKVLTSQHDLDGEITGWRWTDPGLHGGYVYPAREKLPRPATEPADINTIRSLVSGSKERPGLFTTWNFKRPLVDVRLLLGGVGASMIGGALHWRPNIWITGGRGTGKSTLNGGDGVLSGLFGGGEFRTDNASEAAIRQSLNNSTVPVMFDELEAKANNHRVNSVIELARISSSGGKIDRGGADGQAQQFMLRSCFWFSSINIPPLQAQDRSRLAILELKPFDAATPPPVLSDWHLPQLGRQIMRRMVDGWHRLEATKARFHHALAMSGHDARGCDQFGTLLACADVLLHDHDTRDGLPDDEETAHWASLCAPERMIEISEAESDQSDCLQHMLTSPVQARGGDEREALAEWVGKATAMVVEPLLHGEPNARADERSGQRLQQLGLKLVNARFYPATTDKHGKPVKARWGAVEMDKDEPGWLAVAAKHQALDKIFDNTHWNGGVWRQAMARVNFKGEGWDLNAIDGVKVKFGRTSQRAVLVPLAAVLDASELPDASAPEAAARWIAEQKKGDDL